MNRRRFIYNSSIASLSVLGLNSCNQLFRDVKITILHSNDVHIQIEPFPLNHNRFPGRGGFARRANIFNEIRSVNPNTLIFDAGDIFQGTPYFNFFQGELELKLMKEMGYNAATIGNHEFDAGLDTLKRNILRTNFQFIISNYDFLNTELEGLKGFLLFATQPQRDRSLRYNTIRDVMSVLKKVQIDKKLVIRPHPKEKDDTLYYRASLETGYTDFIIDRITDLQSHFELCDTLIVSFSTVGTEFISHFKPMIVFDYNKQDLMGWIHNKVGIPVYEKADFEKILRKNSLTVVKSINESYIQNFYLTDKSTISNLKESIGAN